MYARPFDRSKLLTLTVPEAAEVIGISISATYDAAARGQIPTIRIGRRVLVIRSGLLDLLENKHQ